MRVTEHWNRLSRELAIPGNIQGHVEQGSEQPDLLEDVLAHRGWVTGPVKVPSRPNRSVTDSVIRQHLLNGDGRSFS